MSFADALAAETIEAWIVGRIALALGVDPTIIDPTEPFAATGLTSPDAIALTGELADWLGVEVPATAPWDHPTPAHLAEALLDEVGATGRPPAER
jgi:acyl carrier protein